MTVTFCGHGKYAYGDDVKDLLKVEIEKLINSGADTFYLGGYGKFDGMAANILTELKQEYPFIKRILVLAYLNRWFDAKLYDESVYPPLEKVPPKFCISKRNEWMINKSDVVIGYIRFIYGGAYNTFEYAKKRKKITINMAC